MGVLIIIFGGFLLACGIGGIVVGATVCGVLGKARGRSLWHYGGAGALFGWTLTGWVYVAARALDRQLSWVTAILVFAWPYLLWLTLAPTPLLYIGPTWGEYYFGAVSSVAISSLYAFVSLVLFVGWGLSLWLLVYSWLKDRRAPPAVDDLNGVYLTPFIGFYLAALGVLFVAFVAATYLVNNGVDIQGF